LRPGPALSTAVVATTTLATVRLASRLQLLQLLQLSRRQDAGELGLKQLLHHRAWTLRRFLGLIALMAFRDQDVAERAHREVLQQRVAELERANAELVAGAQQTNMEVPNSRRQLPRLALGMMLLTGLSAAVAPSAPYRELFTLASVVAAVSLFGAVSVLVVHVCVVTVPLGAIAVLLGRTQLDEDGTLRPYRVRTQGRTVRLPLLERLAWLDGRFQLVEAEAALQTRDGERLHTRLNVNVRIARQGPALYLAIERFLDEDPARSTTRIREAVRDLLLATAQELASDSAAALLRENPLKVARALEAQLQDSVGELGLELRGTVVLVEPTGS